MLIDLDIENQKRSALLGEKQPSRGAPDLQHYFARPKYDPAEDIALVECSCNNDVRRKFLSSKLTTTLGGVVTRWKTDERTKGLRVPVLLALGCCCRAFDQPRRVPRPDDNDAEHFLRFFRQLARRLGQNPDANQRPIEPKCPRDTTLDLKAESVRNQLNAVEFAPIFSILLETPAVPRAAMLIEKRTALIIVPQIALLRPIREGAPRMPHVMAMVLANKFGRVLTIFDSCPQEAVVPFGVIDFDSRRTSAIDMRRAILALLGNNNVLVGFHVAWTLTAFNLPLPACRVVDLGAEEAYQLFCFKVSSAFPVWRTLFVERLTKSLDRRIPAVFLLLLLEPSIFAQSLRPAGYRI